MEARIFVVTVEMPNAIRLALDLAAQHAIIELVDHAPDFLDVADRFRTIVRKHPHQSLRRWRTFIRIGIDGIVSQQCIFGQHGARIDAKAIYPPPHPKAQHVSHCGTNFRISPVEIGLLQEE